MVNILKTLALLAGTCSSFTRFEDYSELTETVFVFEMARHGARSDEAHITSPL